MKTTLSVWIILLFACQVTASERSPRIRGFTEQERHHWAFQPIQNPFPPEVADGGWCRTDIDCFVYHRLEDQGLRPAEQADKVTLIRRATLDLTGLPPTRAEIDAFVNDSAENAYERLIDRLLESEQYGVRWARHWLDWVRYAESDGYKADHFRPNAWRYRDYVVDAFNTDKPFDRFVLEQLAGDEVAPNDPNALIATGFLRLGIYEYNQRDARTQWNVILNELTDVTGDVFLGMSMSCARCHDHKFDPVRQQDYYRLQAFFTPIRMRDDIPIASPQQWLQHQAQQALWEEATADIRSEIDSIERPRYDKAAKAILNTFPDDVKAMIFKAPAERTPFERQLVALAERQAVEKGTAAVQAIKGDEKERLAALKEALAKFDGLKPKPLPTAMTVSDIGSVSPTTHIDGNRTTPPLAPGYLSIFDPQPATIRPVPSAPNSTGRRTALAKWLTRPDNLLTVRVIVNRIWQVHFGRGLVKTPSEFGKLGTPPSHPALLDWLANRFVADGWRFKAMHRLIMTSSVYRQTAKRRPGDAYRHIDPENRLLWRMNLRRLQAEEIRDAMLSVSGELDDTLGGKSVAFTANRRSLFVKVLRNTRDRLMEVFDAPNAQSCTAVRYCTTTPLQALYMMNDRWVLDRAAKIAANLQDRCGDNSGLVETAYLDILGRKPSSMELTRALSSFFESVDPSRRLDATTDLCHVLLNANEFLYVQ